MNTDTSKITLYANIPEWRFNIIYLPVKNDDVCSLMRDNDVTIIDD